MWQVTSILLFSGIISTLIINLVIDHSITWSIYLVTVSLIIFSYVSLFAFWHTKRNYQLIAGWALSTILLIALDVLLGKTNWPLQLAWPLLCAVNLVAVVLITLISLTRYRGVNVIAYTSVAIGVLCLGIEGIISFYANDHIEFRWSVIVAACLLPVIAGLLFMHFRVKKNPEMEKIFHT